MKEIAIEDLEAGTAFNKPVYIDGENLLVPAKIELKEKDIDRLRKWGIKKVLTDGEEIKKEKVEKKLEKKSDTDEDLLKCYEDVLDKMDSFFSDCRRGLRLNKKEIDEVMKEFYPHLLENPDEALILTTTTRECADRLSKPAVDNMILSTKMGLSVNLPPLQLVNIATGALVHDVGMAKIPEDIIKKKGALTPQEIETIKKHTVYAYRLLVKSMGFDPEVGRVAMSHHERWDGKGYPSGLTGSKIHIGGRILSVTDAFIAMKSDRADRTSVIGYNAVRQIMNDNSRRFDPAVLKIFIKNVGIYPTGSIVILNNNAIGKIKKVKSKAPLRPELKIIVDENGKKPEKGNDLIDLYENKDLFITKAVDPRELNKR
ncbi:MAG: HD-GYP domain-containing protein [Spirochaetales bacterium]|nr:HD-GYP domain-containing protein [Spirochaetales bacterium]